MIAFDDEVDRRYVEIETGVQSLLARQTPVAIDLRLVLAVLRVNLHLERMADYCVTVAKLTKLMGYLNVDDERISRSIEDMGQRAEQMIRVAMDAFAARDAEKAQTLVELDELIDRANRNASDDLLSLGTSAEEREYALRMLVVSRLAVSVAAIASFGVVALWVNRVNADQPFTARFAAGEIARGLIGLHVHGSPNLTGNFGEWYGLALPLLGAWATIWVLAGWLAPWRHRVRQEERERKLAHALVHAWATDTLAPFVLRADKSYFFDENETAFIAYRVVAGVAIVSGDPIGPEERFTGLVERFLAFARERGWRVAILGVSERWLPLYESHGLRALYHGDEAVVDTASFSLDGRAIRKVRQSVHRLEREGYTARVLRPSEVDASLRDELEGVARAWRGREPERGFVMALDALFRLGDDDALFVVGFAPSGHATGFLHFAVSPRVSALSLSSMPRLRDTPNGFNEWLICESIAWAQEHGFARVSLNFSPFAALLAPEADLSQLERVQKRALMTLKGHFQLDNLLAFNRKFFPRWERRFIVYERRRDLPRVGIAALAAEAYLPFQGQRK